MKSPRNVHRPYTLEISAEAWSQVARLTRERYRAIQACLEGIAAQAHPADAPSSFDVDELTVHHVVDPRRRLVTLVRIVPRAPGSSVTRATHPFTS
ncbi:hypothetical protein LZ198_11260 [Myxococcus sp. K15C18031901]|uniref:hypothetical protein n=1 Tax=Myxococcus dinghuensis TaxID=2906761 RepID=UPI0020A6E0AC|nr:hypothetical protein [Myxococcus dinghuensis]MCP3099448.1 hypothetical protein [Myxococcus dinghuensis]